MISKRFAYAFYDSTDSKLSFDISIILTLLIVFTLSFHNVNGELEKIDLQYLPIGNITDGSLQNPRDVTVHPDGNIYVVDTFEGRGESIIKVFSPEGELLELFDITDPKNPIFPMAISIDKNGIIHILVEYPSGQLYGIKKYTDNGTLIQSWDSYCDIQSPNPNLRKCVDPDGRGPLKLGDGQLYDPKDIEVDPQGNVYVADYGNDRIQKFNSQGSPIEIFRTFCTLAQENRTCIDPGRLTESRPGPLGDVNGSFTYPHSVHLDVNGDLFISGEETTGIQKFSGDKFETIFGLFNSSLVSTDRRGNVFVVDLIDNKIRKFDSNGTLIGIWGSAGYSPGQFYEISGIDVDNGGNVYISDVGSDRVQKFSNNGTLLTMWGDFVPKTFWPFEPSDLVVKSDGNIIVADSRNNMTLEFNSFGKLLSMFKVNNFHIDSIGLDHKDNLYIVDAKSGLIHYTNGDSEGFRTFDFGTLLYEPKTLADFPVSVAFNNRDELFVALNDFDAGKSKIVKISSAIALNTTIPENLVEPYNTLIYSSEGRLSVDNFGHNGTSVYAIEEDGHEKSRHVFLHFLADNDTIVKSLTISNCDLDSGEECIGFEKDILNYQNRTLGWPGPVDIAVDNNEDLLVLNERNGIIGRFNGTGEIISSWNLTIPESNISTHYRPNLVDIYIGNSSDIYVIDSSHLEGKILHYTKHGKLVDYWSSNCALYFDGYKSGNPYC